VCPERIAMAVKKKSSLRLMSNFHLHRHGHWIAFTESEAKVIWTHFNLAGGTGWIHTATGTTCTAGRTGAVKRVTPAAWDRRCRTDSESE
jgi:hypothetical protein